MKAYLRWHLRRAAAAAGWPGLAASIMLLACAALQGLVLPPLREGNARLARQQVAAAAKPAAAVVQPVLATALPPHGDMAQDLAVLYGIASQNGLQLTQGDYAESAASGLTQLDLTLPLNATWPQLHGFIAQVLDKLPHAALTGLRVARQKSDAQQVDAQLRFRLFMQAPT